MIHVYLFNSISQTYLDKGAQKIQCPHFLSIPKICDSPDWRGRRVTRRSVRYVQKFCQVVLNAIVVRMNVPFVKVGMIRLFQGHVYVVLATAVHATLLKKNVFHVRRATLSLHVRRAVFYVMNLSWDVRNVL